ncbi:uncharacterized protein LOC118805026 [Colossoma macropomum]|uniref:uncharacterized protein LOC118805026 n=1 Tax=Colossoma macropomum TaxID=42526 RepID=UPI001863DFF2|nr:uncharacterized protein LOC118805026 [Colossoma macropomum]
MPAGRTEYLTPAPVSIAILGELVFISSKTDFSINKNPPKDGYKALWVKYPDSFCACLMQVCNSGWWAFNEAHKNMDQIRLHTMAVPDYMKTAVNILFQSDDEVVKTFLPDQLENICVIADDCIDLANKTEKRFTNVIKIIHELLEACINAEHFHGEELEVIKKKLEETKLREHTSKEANERLEKAAKAMEKELQEARENYSKALDSLPCSWDMIAMNLGGRTADGIATMPNGMTSVVVKTVDTGLENPQMDNGGDIIDEINIYSKSAEILTYTQNILKNVRENKIDWKSLYDQKNKATKTELLKKQLTTINTSIETIPECKPKKQASELCNEAINICNELAKYAPDGKCEEAKTVELIKRI